MIGFLFTLLAKDDETTKGRNVFSVTILTLVSNLFLLWRIALNLDIDKRGLQLSETYNWLDYPKIDLVFGIDMFSLLIIAAIHISLIISLAGIRHRDRAKKSLYALCLLFLAMINGLFISADIYSFYIFFEAMLLPLFFLSIK